MQTFLPFASFIHSVECLDDKRLNKQIVEAYQILMGRVPNANHPACLMWRGYEHYLREYATICCILACRAGRQKGKGGQRGVVGMGEGKRDCGVGRCTRITCRKAF